MARTVLLAVVFSAAVANAAAQAPSAPEDTRTQYPRLLQNSYVGVEVGWMDSGFSAQQLEPGVTAGTISVPHLAARVAIFGHEFNRFLSVQGTYLRPVRFVTYRGLSIDGSTRHVWTQFAGVTLDGRLPLTGRLSGYLEGGLGITSRHGFTVADAAIVPDAHYAAALGGAGLSYHLSDKWDVTAGALYSPGKAAVEEPHTVFASAGLRYTMRALAPEQVAANRDPAIIFPVHVVQVEYSTPYGYGINTFLSKDVPVFWGGNVETDAGVSGHYQQNVFHTRKRFGLDVGTSVGVWRSRADHQRFFTLSAYPLFRFTLLRRRPADFYVTYSLAGPTYISRTVIDASNTGNHFTFQDSVGVGVFVGAQRRTSIAVKVNHYSNGNIFTENAGVTIPLTIGIGRTF